MTLTNPFPLSIYSLAILQNTYLASAGQNGSIAIWDYKTGVLKNTLYGHTNTVNCLLSLANENQTLISGGDTTIKLWNITTGKCIKTLIGHIDTVNCLKLFNNYNNNDDQSTLMSGSNDGTIKIWNIKLGQIIK